VSTCNQNRNRTDPAPQQEIWVKFEERFLLIFQVKNYLICMNKTLYGSGEKTWQKVCSVWNKKSQLFLSTFIGDFNFGMFNWENANKILCL
jgi:hypothetical protein